MHRSTVLEVIAEDDDDAMDFTQGPPLSNHGSNRTTSSASDRSVSPAPTLQSLSGSMFESLFCHKHGRKVNSTCKTYSMAADDEENDRMDHEHQLYKILLNHRFGDQLVAVPGPVNELLKTSPADVQPKRILDLGTGTAAWAMDMAKRFPDCDVVGIDLVPLPPSDIEVDDLNLPLDHHEDSAHLVHIRLLSSGITDYAGLLHKCGRILKVGGLLHVIETDFRAYARPDASCAIRSAREPSDPHYSAIVHWMKMLVAAMHHKRANIDAPANIRRWIKDDKQYEEVMFQDLFLPIFPIFRGGTPEDEFQNEMARRVRKDLKLYLSTSRPLILDYKKADVVERVVEAAEREIEHPKYQFFVRVVVLVAKKIGS
ncbi:hypothetical protein FRB99_004069 [Tulasnella sp. 403]|nr:hypothetical protein FRB99_004069 [Tulasnella sp. 403]